VRIEHGASTSARAALTDLVRKISLPHEAQKANVGGLVIGFLNECPASGSQPTSMASGRKKRK
jgi:hypothetical protein